MKKKSKRQSEPAHFWAKKFLWKYLELDHDHGSKPYWTDIVATVVNLKDRSINRE